MKLLRRLSRRNALKTGLASITTATIAAPSAHAVISPKAPGETKIVAILGHDAMHNGVAYETYIRSILRRKKNWRLIFCRSNKYFTPELISDADLLMTQLFGGPYVDHIEGITDRPEARKPLWNDELVEAVVDNVRNRGMGWMALHNSIWFGKKELEELMGTKPVLHQEIQPLIFKDFNQEHPITRGMDDFFINLDEQFNVELMSPSTTTVLFRTLAVHDKNDAVGGWCREQGKGRVVGLLPGHEHWCYRVPEYQKIFWRAAHWAMGREIEPFNK
ncbi:MAG: hypothetical protein HOC71_11010 [Candidatus Latescibacteria bacterium]|jgi:type 1 glutamine amidotransferase|nr:hypothetical protein [Candidatus Latescibacterota bacterium]